MTDSPDAPVPPDPDPPKLPEVEEIRDDLFHGFRSYHTPIKQQRALVERLIEAARLEGRDGAADDATRDEMRRLFHRVRTSARNAEPYDEVGWMRLAELLRSSGLDLMSESHESGGQ